MTQICHFCKKEDPEGSQKTHTSCDRCRNIVCYSCTMLSSTELRVLALSKRNLKYFCPSCENSTESSNTKFDYPSDTQYLKEQSKLLREIINDKEIIISDKDYIIKVLEDKMDLLKEKYSTAKKVNQTKNSNMLEFTNNSSCGKIERQDLSASRNTNLKKNLSSETNNSKAVKNSTEQDGTADKTNRSLEFTNNHVIVVHEDTTGESSGELSEKILESSKDIGNLITVQRKRSVKKRIGEGEDNNGKFGGAKPKVWMYLYRIRPDVKKEDIIDYVKEKTKEQESNIVVKELRNDFAYVDDGNYKCYMVGADLNFKKEFYTPQFWPKGVGFKRFDFKVHAKYIISEQSDKNKLSQRPDSFLVKS